MSAAPAPGDAAGGAAASFTMAETATLPPFPLQTVLYPGGVLPLKTFQVR